MKNTRSIAIAGIGLLAAICPLMAPRSARAEVAVAKPQANDAVTVTENDRQWTLANGIVTAKIDKRTGDLETLIFRGIDTMGHDQGRAGYWEQDPSRAPERKLSITIDPAKNGGDRAEVSIAGKTGGTVMLTPDAPGGGTMCDLEIRYAMGRGESGIYAYAIFSHPAAYGPMSVGESRYITKLNQTFDWLSVDADRNMLACAPTDWGTGVVVHAKEQRIMSKGVYKNSVEHKYSYTAVQYKIPAYGWSSTKEKIGVWFINPSIEYLSGGATKQELVCHFGDNGNPDPIILNYWRGTHYNGGASCGIAGGEEWSKVVGPIFVYCNALEKSEDAAQGDLDALKETEGNPTVPSAWTNNATALWMQALEQAKIEKSRWPYDWVGGIDYPHKDARGKVVGKIALVDPQAPTTKLPHLTVGLAHPDYARVGGFGGGGRGRGRRGGFGGGGPNAGGGNDNRTSASLARGDRGARPQANDNRTSSAQSQGNRGGSFGGGGGGFGGGRGGNASVDWMHDAKYYQFWNDGAEDGTFAIENVRPGKYTLHAFADGVLGVFAKTDITVEAGKTLDLGALEWKPVRKGKQVWEIGVPNRTAGEFYKGDGENYWLWGWCLRYPLLFPNDITYTVGKSDWSKDWFFEQVPRGDSRDWLNPSAKDPANQRFGWVKAESLDEYPQTNTRGPWQKYGQGQATTWTVKFKMEDAGKGAATLRVALAGSDGNGGLEVGVNGTGVGAIRTQSTNALRYNTNKSVWYEYDQPFDAALLKPGENAMTFTVPAGELTSGVVWDYLRLEVDQDAAAGEKP